MGLLGGKIEDRALLFPQRLYEISLLQFNDRTIVDSSFVTGHYEIYGKLAIGPCQVGGVLHEGSCALNALVLSGSDPWRAFVGTHPQNYDGRFSKKRRSRANERQKMMMVVS